MTGRDSEESGRAAGFSRSADAADGALQRRAHQLCRGAEPHADEVPCPGHVQEAQRQLFGLVV